MAGADFIERFCRLAGAGVSFGNVGRSTAPSAITGRDMAAALGMAARGNEVGVHLAVAMATQTSGEWTPTRSSAWSRLASSR